MALVCFKNALDEKKDFQCIDREYLLPCCELYAHNNPDLFEDILKKKVLIYKNNKLVPIDYWPFTEVNNKDEITIVPEIAGGKNTGAYIQIGIGIALIVAGAYAGPEVSWYGYAMMAGGMAVLGGLSQLMFQPNLPTISSSGSDSSQTYNWDGISTTARTDIPVPVVYGTHPVGGNIISVYSKTSGYDDYLYMLLGLSEGPINGICQYNMSATLTSITHGDNSSEEKPYIEVDGQPIVDYDDWEWWYRPGNATQTKIPGFDGVRTQYTSGDEVTTSGLTYTTTGAVDMVDVELSAPALYRIDEGEIKKHEIEYKIEYKYNASDVATYKELEVNKYQVATPVTANPGRAGDCELVSYKYGENYLYSTATPLDVIVEVTENTFDLTKLNNNGVGRVEYVITVNIEDEDGNTIESDVELKGIYNKVKKPNPEYEQLFGRGPKDNGEPEYIYETNHNKPYFNAGIYTVGLSHDVSANNKFTLKSEESSQTKRIKLIDKTKTGVKSSITIDFRDLGLKKETYDIRFKRTDGGSSNDFETENNLLLDSVVEVVQGNFTYPNTALLGLKLKASGQLSGTPPNVITRIQGRTIEVPSMDVGDFNDCYWDDSASKWKDISTDTERTWDNTTYTSEYSNNSMLCVRDLILSKRYGLGEYIKRADMSTSGIINAIKQCHIWYSDSSDHYHTFDGVLETEQSAMTLLLEICESFRCWPVWKDGKLDFILDIDDTPVHTIHMSNIKSFSQSFVPLSEIPYKIYGQFTSKGNDYDLRSIVARSTDTTLNKLNENTIGLKGITDFRKATRELKFKLNKVTNCTHNINAKCGIDVIHASAGDIVYLQHDLPQFGHAGRIVSYDKTQASILIDTDYTVVNKSNTHTIRMQDENNDWVEGTLDVSGKTNGTSYRTFPLTSHVGTPCDNGGYTIGVTGGEPKKFRIYNIARTEDNEVELNAIEHLSTLYTDPQITIVDDDYSALPNPLAKPKRPVIVAIDTLENELGFYIKARPPSNSEGIVDIAIQISTDRDKGYTYIGSCSSPNWEMTYRSSSLVMNKTYYFRLFCRTAHKTSDYITAEVTLESSKYVLKPPSGIHIVGYDPNVMTFDGVSVTIAWNPVGLSADQSAVVKDYIVEVYHLESASEVLSTDNFIKEYYSTSEEFAYSYEENLKNENNTIACPIIAFILRTRTNQGAVSAPSVPFVVSNTVPNMVSNLYASPYMGQAKFNWDHNTEPDLMKYLYRFKIESGSYSSWTDTKGNEVMIGLTQAQKANGDDTITFQVKAMDKFGQYGAQAESQVDVDSLNIAVTDIDEFHEDMSNTFIKIPVLESDVWTANSPSAGYVAWNEHSLWHNGTEYTISANNTNKEYIWWDKSSPTGYQTQDTHPVDNGDLTDPDTEFIIGLNNSGNFERAWMAIPNAAIGSAFIKNAAINDAHVNNLSAAKITSGYIDAARIDSDTITADMIDLTDIDLDDLDGTTYTTIKKTYLSAGRIDLSECAGNIDDIDTDGDYAPLLKTSISAGKISVSGLVSDVTDRMFADSNTKTNMENWVTDTTKIDGAYIQTGTIQAGAVEAGFIDAFSIDADNITAGTLTADRISAGSIEYDKISSANGVTESSSSASDSTSITRISGTIALCVGQFYVSGNTGPSDTTKTVTLKRGATTIATWKRKIPAETSYSEYSSIVGIDTASVSGSQTYTIDGATGGEKIAIIEFRR